MDLYYHNAGIERIMVYCLSDVMMYNYQAYNLKVCFSTVNLDGAKKGSHVPGLQASFSSFSHAH
jgi:hypothetical protein